MREQIPPVAIAFSVCLTFFPHSLSTLYPLLFTYFTMSCSKLNPIEKLIAITALVFISRLTFIDSSEVNTTVCNMFSMTLADKVVLQYTNHQGSCLSRWKLSHHFLLLIYNSVVSKISPLVCFSKKKNMKRTLLLKYS